VYILTCCERDNNKVKAVTAAVTCGERVVREEGGRCRNRFPLQDTGHRHTVREPGKSYSERDSKNGCKTN